MPTDSAASHVGWHERAPLLAMRAGSVAGALGMVAGQVAAGATSGQVIFTGALALAFVLVVFGIVRGTERRLARTGIERVPAHPPWAMVGVGLWSLSVVMWLLAVFGAVLIVRQPGQPEHAWNLLAYVGVAACATGAAVLIGRMRRDYDQQYSTR